MTRSNSTRRRSLSRFEAVALLGAALALGGGYWLFSSDAAAKDDAGQAVKTAGKIRDAARDWRSAHSGCPSLTQLQQAKVLDDEVEDPWGSRFRVSCDSNDDVTVFSPGRDGKLGTADDVKSRG
ncbi:MAG: hypothetical protein AB7K71_06660 [Polyangiaceae bacterium]